MAPPKVIVIGCGISGPAIAIILQRKGYDPIIFEKSTEPGDLGASLMISPNGMKVLDLIDVAPKLLGLGPAVSEIIDSSFGGERLGGTSLPEEYQLLYGQPAKGVKRTVIMALMKDAAIENGIDIRTGFSLESIQHTESSVVAQFEGGHRVQGSFIVGCDGIRAITRGIVLERHGVEDAAPNFTGLTQMACLSPTPQAIKGSAGMRNWYGPGLHIISYPLTDDLTSWAITQAESDRSRDTWGLYENERRVAAKEQLLRLLEGCDDVVRDLANTAERIIKYGIYDRPGLDSGHLHSGRCVLIGDAAHPTSVHLGQGANLSLEDCYQLSEALPSMTDREEQELTLAQLSGSFATYSAIQQPRTTDLVRASRRQGELRVVTSGPHACEERDMAIRAAWADSSAVRKRFDAIYAHPF